MVVIVDGGSSGRPRGLFTLDVERDGALRVVRLSYRRRAAAVGYLLGVRVVARRLAREGSPVDVIHAHVHWMGWGAFILGGLLRRPTVISEHSSEWLQGQVTKAALRRAKVSFRRAALVCPVSFALQRAIESYGIRARFRVVPNTVDTGVFHPSSNRASGPPTRLVNVALHRDVKGVDILLHAFARVVKRRSALTLDLIGEGPQTPELQRLISELGLAKRVRVLGAMEPVQVAAALRASDLFVLPSRNETLGASVIEALATGVPVVATKVGGVPEVVGPEDGVLTGPDDIEQLAESIERAVDDYDRFDRDAIAERARDRFSLDAVGRAWDLIYTSVQRTCKPYSDS
jgi:glycosyltransferase involved in cell wall biosynthesis